MMSHVNKESELSEKCNATKMISNSITNDEMRGAYLAKYAFETVDKKLQ